MCFKRGQGLFAKENKITKIHKNQHKSWIFSKETWHDKVDQFMHYVYSASMPVFKKTNLQSIYCKKLVKFFFKCD